MSTPAQTPAPTKQKSAWKWFILLLAGIYLFWILPIQLGPRHIAVQYEPAKTSR